MKVIAFAPDFENIRAWFDIPKRYYQRNKEMVEACDLLHAFISAEDGFIGGTRFQVEYAVGLGIPVQLHLENGPSQWIFQYSFPFFERNRHFSWQGKGFLIKYAVNLEAKNEVFNLRVPHRFGRKGGHLGNRKCIRPPAAR